MVRPIDELEPLTVAWTPPPDAFATSPAGRMAARHGTYDARPLAQTAALGKAMAPSAIHVVEALPKTATTGSCVG